MPKKFIIGNWKMNGSIALIETLLQQILQSLAQQSNKPECVILPPAVYLPLVKDYLSESPIKWGAQNVYPKDAGAFTGELSAPMLLDYDCRYVLVGHSERRRLFGEDEKFVADKFHHVKEHGMIPVLCVGETLEEREQDLTNQVIAKQLLAVAGEDIHCFKDSVIAYEPVWAIGTGQTATPEQAQNAHSSIRAVVADIDPDDADQLPILYGGSVNEKNATSLFAMPDVDGGLLGGASLNAQQFVEIVKCIN
jgi:triosephosphate isomerase (TIM)